MSEAVPGVDQVETRGLVEEGVVVVRFIDAVARERRSPHARIHVKPEDDVVVLAHCRVVGRSLVDDVVVPKDDVAGLRIGPLEPSHLDPQPEAVARRVTRVRVVEPGVIEVVVHDRVTLLVGGRALPEVPVPAAAPARIVGIVELVGPLRGPGARVVADRRRPCAIDGRVGLEVARSGLEAHDAVESRADGLPLPESGLHEIDVLPVDRVDLGEHEGRDAVRVVHPAALGHLDRVEHAQVDVARVRWIVADHAEVPVHGADVGGVMEPRALGIEAPALIGRDRHRHVGEDGKVPRQQREGGGPERQHGPAAAGVRRPDRRERGCRSRRHWPCSQRNPTSIRRGP